MPVPGSLDEQTWIRQFRSLTAGSCNTVKMPDEGLNERKVCSVKGWNSLASTEITSSLPNSWLPALYFVCDEHAGNFQKGGHFSVDPRKGNIDLGFIGRLGPTR